MIVTDVGMGCSGRGSVRRVTNSLRARGGLPHAASIRGCARSIRLRSRGECIASQRIASPLHIEPETRAVAEHAGENERGRRGHIATIVTQFVDVLALNPHGISQRALRQADRLHEFLDQNFADRRRFAFCHQHGLPDRPAVILWIGTFRPGT